MKTSQEHADKALIFLSGHDLSDPATKDIQVAQIHAILAVAAAIREASHPVAIAPINKGDMLQALERLVHPARMIPINYGFDPHDVNSEETPPVEEPTDFWDNHG